MIIDLQHFLRVERPNWEQLEALLTRIEENPDSRLSLEETCRFHYLYDRAGADLLRISTFASSPEIARYLESLVARAYGEIHEVRGPQRRFLFWTWISRTLPRTFRRHILAFYGSLALTILGALFGAGALWAYPDAKPSLLPFEHLEGRPSERVAREEKSEGRYLTGHKAGFAGMLMTHNIRISIYTLAMGMTYGVGTVVVLFYNGVILGAVSFDYIQDGQGRFLIGWLLPHGSIEIPSIIIAGQAGFVLAGALIGSRRRMSLRERLAAVRLDLVTLIGGFSLMLVWAGCVEAFFSQYHEPVLPYGFKIGFGLLELVLLCAYYGFAGRRQNLEGGRIRMRLNQSGRKTVQIQTPEGIVFNLTCAGLFTRFLAWTVDASAISAANTFIVLAVQFIALISPDLANGLFAVLYALLSVGYGIVTEWKWRGQSLGKRLLRLRVMDASGLKLQLSQIVIRNLLRPIDLLPIAYFLGGLVAFGSRRNQRLGDLAASTIVVAAPQEFAPDTRRLSETKYNSFRDYPHLEARLRQRISAAEAALALDALLRRDEISPDARIEIFREIAVEFRALVPFEAQVDESITDEQYVRNAVASLYRQAARQQLAGVRSD